MVKKIQIGDIVSIVEEGYAYGKVGRVISLLDTELRNKLDKKLQHVSRHTPVMFPRFLAARWFDQHDCIHATEAERKIYFMDILKHGEKFTN